MLFRSPLSARVHVLDKPAYSFSYSYTFLPVRSFSIRTHVYVPISVSTRSICCHCRRSTTCRRRRIIVVDTYGGNSSSRCSRRSCRRRQTGSQRYHSLLLEVFSSDQVDLKLINLAAGRLHPNKPSLIRVAPHRCKMYRDRPNKPSMIHTPMRAGSGDQKCWMDLGVVLLI